MGSLSNYLETAILDHVFGATPYTPATNKYIALYTVAPLEDGTGGTEVSGGDYERVVLNTWGVASTNGEGKGEITNSDPVQFPTATADWGTVVAVGIWDDVSAGNMLGFSNLTVQKTVFDGDTASIAAGAITITLD